MAFYDFIRDDGQGNRYARYLDQFITWLITLNIASIILESYGNLAPHIGHWLHGFEVFSVVVFSAEYLLRLFTAPLQYPQARSPLHAAWRFARSSSGIIDLLAILPFYVQWLLPLVHTPDLRFVRMLRLMRLIRIFKLHRHSKAFRMIREVMADARADIMVTLFITFILMVIASALMFYIESEVQPEKFAHMGDAFWWAVATLTTVGYGDVYPVTPLGKLISGIIALLGIGMVALPTGVISSAFMQRVQAHKQGALGAQSVEERLKRIEEKIDRIDQAHWQNQIDAKDAQIAELREQLRRLRHT